MADLSYLKQLEHDTLIKLTCTFVPALPPKGVCNGFTSMWLQAVATNDEQEAFFYQRLDALSRYLSNPQSSITSLKNQVEAIYDTQKGPANVRKKLTLEDNSLIDIQAFAENIALQQYPGALQIFPEPIRQQDKDTLYPFTASMKLDSGSNLQLMTRLPSDGVPLPGIMYVEKVGNQLKYILLGQKEEIIEAFLDVTVDGLTKKVLQDLKPSILQEARKRGHTLKIRTHFIGTVAADIITLEKYFNETKAILEAAYQSNPAHKKMGFLFGSNCHSVGLYLQPESNVWHFLDINKLSGKKTYYYSVDTTQLAALLFQSFFDDKISTTAFTLRCISNWHNDPILASLREITQKTLPSSVAKVNSRGDGALHLSSSYGDTLAVKKLLELGEKRNASNKHKKNPLMFAAEAGHTEVVQAVLDTKRKSPSTPLGFLMAHTQNAAEFCTALVKWNLNSRDENGNTALIYAAAYGYSDTVKLLIQHGACTQMKNHGGDTALTLASKHGHLNTIKALLNTKKESSGFQHLSEVMFTIQNPDLALSQLLIPDIELPDKQGNTPLMLAAGNGKEEIVEFLLSKKAKINQKNHQGNTALMLAAQGGHQIIKLLISHGASLNCANRQGYTALTLAKKNNHDWAVKILTENGATERKTWCLWLKEGFCVNKRKSLTTKQLNKKLRF